MTGSRKNNFGGCAQRTLFGSSHSSVSRSRVRERGRGARAALRAPAPRRPRARARARTRREPWPGAWAWPVLGRHTRHSFSNLHRCDRQPRDAAQHARARSLTLSSPLVSSQHVTRQVHVVCAEASPTRDSKTPADTHSLSESVEYECVTQVAPASHALTLRPVRTTCAPSPSVLPALASAASITHG